MRSNNEEFEIFNLDLDESVFESIKNYTILSLNYYENLTDVCGNIRKLTVEKYGGVWQCFAFKRYSGGYMIMPKLRKYASFIFCDISFIIFEAF